MMWLAAMIKNTEQKIHQLINQYRMSMNLPALNLDERISKIARKHSKAMAGNKVSLGNSGFKKRVSKISAFLSHVSATENIASYQGSPVNAELVVQFWLKSEKHRKIIQGDYSRTGIGVAKSSENVFCFTQIFVCEKQ